MIRDLPKGLSYWPRHSRPTAFLARVPRERRIYSRSFSFRVWGGERPAADAALAWIYLTEFRLGKPRSERTVQSLSRRNRSGEMGISVRGGQVHVTWNPIPGRHAARTKFSVRQRGAAEALRIGRERRRAEYLATLEG